MVVESWFFEENLLISLENGLVEDASLKLPNSTQIQAKLYPTFITQQLQEIETWFQKKNNSQAKIGTENKLKIAQLNSNPG